MYKNKIYSLIELYGSYKTMAALFSLFECGALSSLQNSQEINLEYLAESLNLDLDGVLIICRLLENTGWLIRIAEGVYGLSPVLKDDKALKFLSHESYLFETVYSPTNLANKLLKSTPPKHSSSMNSLNAARYLNSFQDVAQISALQAFRLVGMEGFKGLHLDISRPAGYWTEVVQRFLLEVKYYTVSIPFSEYDLKRDVLSNNTQISTLFLFNSFRWLVKNELFTLVDLFDRFKDEGTLIISDIFMNESIQKGNLWHFIEFEWWAFDQATLVDLNALTDWLYVKGFKPIQKYKLDDFFYLLIFKKRSTYE